MLIAGWAKESSPCQQPGSDEIPKPRPELAAPECHRTGDRGAFEERYILCMGGYVEEKEIASPTICTHLPGEEDDR
jgi:hypothetical protein